MIEEEPVFVDISLDTSRFKEGLTRAQFSLTMFGEQWSPEALVTNAGFNLFWEFDETMERIKRIMGEWDA